MDIIKFLDSPIAFQRCLVDVTGSVTGALLLSQAIYWQNRCQHEDGWFWKTQEEWETETGMKRREFEGARKACEGILEHDVRGVPATTHYRVNSEALQTRLDEVCKLKKQANSIGRNIQTISTKITSENTNPPSGEKVSELEKCYRTLEQLPVEKRTQRVVTAWQLWVKCRMAKKKCKDFEMMFSVQVRKLADFTEPNIVACLEYSMANDYQGLCFDRFENGGAGGLSPRRPNNPPQPPTREYGERF